MGKETDRFGEGASGKKPKTKRFKQTTNRLRQKDNHLSHRPSVEWHLDQTRVCEKYGDVVDYVGLDRLKAIILKSRTGTELLNGDAAKGLEIYYDPQTLSSQFYQTADRKIITLNPHRPKGDLVNLLSKELRACWQHHQGALVNPLSYDPEEAVLVNRAQQADRLMIAIRIGWELKLAGEPEAWDFMAGSPMADLGRAFEVRAQSDFRSLNNGDAARAAYDKFFEDSRTKIHDKRIIHQMLLDESGYLKLDAKRPKVGMDLFQKLGEMPFGRNYLVMGDKKAPMDTSYQTVEDRSNANFLWFIKFERSFQEKEKQMLEDSVRLSAEIVDFSKKAQQMRGRDRHR